MPYRDFLAAVARAAGLRPPPVLPVPGTLLAALAPLTRLLPTPRIRRAEIRRLQEDKAFDVTAMRQRLGVVGRPLEEGLRQTFAPLAPPDAGGQEPQRFKKAAPCP